MFFHIWCKCLQFRCPGHYERSMQESLRRTEIVHLNIGHVTILPFASKLRGRRRQRLPRISAMSDEKFYAQRLYIPLASAPVSRSFIFLPLLPSSSFSTIGNLPLCCSLNLPIIRLPNIDVCFKPRKSQSCC